MNTVPNEVSGESGVAERDADTKNRPVSIGEASLPVSLARCKSIRARAQFLGENIDVRRYMPDERLGTRPLLIGCGAECAAVLFRYGVLVMFNASRESEERLLREVLPLVRKPYAVPETEELELRLGADKSEGIEDQAVCLRELTRERLQLVASVLSKSVVLAEFEARVAENFDKIEPFAVELREHGRGGRRMKNLLRQIGNVLLTEQKMVGRVEMREKPEFLWEYPALEPLYLRLEDEFEIGERYAALERKLALTSRTVSTVLELLQNHRSMRVEWYIVILIVFEILLTFYEMFWYAPK
jgi:uncharacterized Rmd1/YagE family protein